MVTAIFMSLWPDRMNWSGNINISRTRWCMGTCLANALFSTERTTKNSQLSLTRCMMLVITCFHHIVLFWKKYPKLSDAFHAVKWPVQLLCTLIYTWLETFLHLGFGFLLWPTSPRSLVTCSLSLSVPRSYVVWILSETAVCISVNV